MENTREFAILGGGCFWCTEAIFENLRGVYSVTSGYTGGTTKNPTYEEVSSGTTGHAEAVKIEFNPEEISYHDLLTVFFASHDPTTPNRQGNDVGPQYRSSLFYVSEAQKTEAEEFIRKLKETDPHGKPIVTEVTPFDMFYEAESYHKNYFRNNPQQAYCQVIIEPKVLKLQKEFAQLLKTHAKDN